MSLKFPIVVHLRNYIDFKIVFSFKQKKIKNVTDVTEVLPRFEYTIVTSRKQTDKKETMNIVIL